MAVVEQNLDGRVSAPQQTQSTGWALASLSLATLLSSLGISIASVGRFRSQPPIKPVAVSALRLSEAAGAQMDSPAPGISTPEAVDIDAGDNEAATEAQP